MQGSPECSEGFGKIESLLRQARLLRRGFIGNAPSQLMRQREVVSMAIATLKGAGDTPPLRRSQLPWCRVARKFTRIPPHRRAERLTGGASPDLTQAEAMVQSRRRRSGGRYGAERRACRYAVR